MRNASSGPGGGLEMLAMLLAWCVWAASALAQGEPLTVVMRVGEGTDPELVERVRSQLIDMPVRFETRQGGPIEAKLPAALAGARALAEREDARVVVWFQTDPELRAYVAEPAARRLLQRSLGPVETGEARSAQLEAAALVVRTAVRGLTAGGQVGVDERELLAPERPAPEPAAAPQPPVPLPVPDAPAPRRSRVEVWLGAGAQGVLDGASQRGSYAPAAEVLLRVGRLEVDVQGAYGIPASVEDDALRLGVARSHVSAGVGVGVALTPGLWLPLRVGGGASVLTTTASADDPATIDAVGRQRTVVPLLSAEVGLRHVPARGDHRFGWSLRAGIEALPRTPELGLSDGPDFERRARLYPVAPRLSLRLWVRLGR